MIHPPRSWIKTLLLWSLWLLILLVSGILALQLHATLVALAWHWLQSPLRPTAWNSQTITALSRFLYLVVGGGWLFGVAFVEPFLASAQHTHTLRPRVLRLLAWLMALYLACYLGLWLVAWGAGTRP